MKTTIPIFVGIAVFLTVICVVKSRKLGKKETQVRSLNQELTEKSNRLDEIQRSTADASPAAPTTLPAEQSAVALDVLPKPEQKSTLRASTPEPVETPVASEAVSTNEAGASKSPTEASGLGKMISQIMQDPETRKMLREQQRMALDQLYSPLAKQLAMTPEESDKLKDLLADQMMEGSAAMFGNQGSSKGNQVAALAAGQTNLDNQVRELLGDDRYEQYKDYQLTVGERMQLTQFKQTLGDSPLTDQQTEQLLGIIKEEKKNIGGPNGEAFSGISPNSKANLDAMLADESAMGKLLQSQNDLNDRVYQRANEVLSPDQLTAFGKFQTNQAALMRLGVTMARKMFSSDGGAGQGK